MGKSLEQKQAEMRSRLKRDGRNEKGQWLKGISGLSGGNPRLSNAIADRLMEGDTYQRLAERIVRTGLGENPKARAADEIKAISEIIDRTEGKALQKHQVVSINLSEETAQRIAEIAEKLATLSSPALPGTCQN